MSETAVSQAVAVESGEVQSEAALPSEEGQRAAFEEWIGKARGLERSEVVPLRADVQLAYANALVAQRSLQARKEDLKRIPGVDAHGLLSIATVALALVHASARVRLGQPGPRDLEPTLARLRQLRAALLSSFEGAAALGLVPEAPLERIAAGKGILDAAQDLVDLCAYAREHHAQLSGRSVATAELLAEGEKVALKVQQEIRPDGAPKQLPPDEVRRLTEDRDRLWTLLVRLGGDAQKVAPLLFGDEAKARVPALQSRQGAPRKKAPAQQPA